MAEQEEMQPPSSYWHQGIEVHPGIPHSLDISCTPPGSKSISNRVLLLSALGFGTCRIKNILYSDNIKDMINAFRKLGAATFTWEEKDHMLIVNGNGGQLRASPSPLDLGNSGTASRFLTAVATLATRSSTDHTILTGSEQLRQRPIGDLVETLKANGADIKYQEKNDSLPVKVTAFGHFIGGRMTVSAKTSSVYTSSLLMCAPLGLESVTLKLGGGKPVSQTYIDITIKMMNSFGIEIKASAIEEHTYHIPQGRYISPSEYVMESDASSATYPFTIAAITGTKCTVPSISSNSLQGDARFALNVLKPMGCTVVQTDTYTSVKGPLNGSLKSLPDVDMEPMTDAFLTTSVLAAVARGVESSNTTRIRGVANQRVKECNRIKAVIDELTKFGVTCREHDDGIEIDGIDRSILRYPPLGVFCYGDHRIALSFSVIALAAPHSTLIFDKESVCKTWPDWWNILVQVFKAKLANKTVSVHN